MAFHELILLLSFVRDCARLVVQLLASQPSCEPEWRGAPSLAVKSNDMEMISYAVLKSY